MLPGAIDTMMAKPKRSPTSACSGAASSTPTAACALLLPISDRWPASCSRPCSRTRWCAPECRLRSKMYEWGHDEARDVDVVVGCCMLAPRHVLEQVGRFDPAFFVYSEEHDLCKRVHDAGLRVVFTPHAEMIHFGGQTSKRMSLRMALVQLDSRTRFFRNHGAHRALPSS